MEKDRGHYSGGKKKKEMLSRRVYPTFPPKAAGRLRWLRQNLSSAYPGG